jgi:4-aminobutyrate aminotransferase-like enzyme
MNDKLLSKLSLNVALVGLGLGVFIGCVIISKTNNKSKESEVTWAIVAEAFKKELIKTSKENEVLKKKLESKENET